MGEREFLSVIRKMTPAERHAITRIVTTMQKIGGFTAEQVDHIKTLISSTKGEDFSGLYSYLETM